MRLDRAGIILNLNLLTAHLLRCSRGRAVGTPLRRYMTRESRPAFDRFIRDCLGSRKRHSMEVELAGNSHRITPVRLTGVRSRDGMELAVTMADITEERITAEDLRRSEAFLDSIIENLPHIIFVKDAKTLRYLRFNQAGERFWGFPRSKLIGKTDRQAFGPKLGAYLMNQDRAVLASNRKLDIREQIACPKCKVMRHLHTQKIKLSGAKGEPGYLLGISEDITEEKLARDQRDYFFSGTLDMLCISSFDGRFLQLNPAFERTLGYSVEELAARPVFHFIHPEDIEATRQAYRVVSAGKPLFGFENRYRHKNGDYRILRWNSRTDTEQKLIYAVARDVTEQRHLEAEVLRISTREQERIAHDLHDGLGQILTGIAYKSKLFEQLLARGAVPSAKMASELVHYANLASTQARALARGLDPVITVEDPVSALESLAESTRTLFGVRCHFHSDLEVIRPDKNVVLQIYRIAQEAINNAVKHGRASTITVSLKRRARDIELKIEDNGKGRPESFVTHNGLGLRIMEYRARTLGAALAVRRRSTGGVSVACRIPHSAFGKSSGHHKRKA